MKFIQGFLSQKVMKEANDFIEVKCEECYRQFKKYKDDHEKL